MQHTFTKFIHLSLALLTVMTVAIDSHAQTTWTPPAARADKTPLAPKPQAGNNIFKGEKDIWLADAVERVEGGNFTPIRDQGVSEYVSAVGNYVASHSVAPTKKYQFIVTTDTCDDAMTAGGGRIYITIGALRMLQSEDELAAVLAHEIAHDAFAHAAKTVTRQLFWMTGITKVSSAADVVSALRGLRAAYQHDEVATIGERMLWFARADELEADRAGFYNIYQAGYNPIAMSSALQRTAAAQKDDEGEKEYRRQQFLLVLFGQHPPFAQRALALSWEANFVKMPARDARFDSPSFRAMKERVERNK